MTASYDDHDRGRPLRLPQTRVRRAYEVVVRKTGPASDHFRPTGKRIDDKDVQYLKCSGRGYEGTIFVVSEDPALIYEKFGIDVVVSIKEIGVGYSMPEDVP